MYVVERICHKKRYKHAIKKNERKNSYAAIQTCQKASRKNWLSTFSNAFANNLLSASFIVILVHTT
jgi:hypothetical protein